MPKPPRGRSRQSESTPASPAAELASTTRQAKSPRSPSGRDGSGKERRPTYPEAVARYEAGMRALQAHRFEEAAGAFRSVLQQYPEEKELNDRVRLYLAVCDRHLQAAPAPKTVEERLYAATLALNAGDNDAALAHLGEIVAQDPDHDAALYMLGVVHARREDDPTALAYLRRAIERNPENRGLALRDADLERLMQDQAFRAALEASGGRPADTRTQSRTRSMR